MTTGAGSGAPDDGVSTAISRERNRLAEALHDGALQDVAVAQQNLAEVDDGVPEALAALRSDLDRLARRLRLLTGGMHEDTLDELPLHRALRRTLDGLHHRTGVEITLGVSHAADQPRGPFVRQAVSELVVNAAQHTDASRISVVVARDQEALVVYVTDDGAGIDHDEAHRAGARGHLGLTRIERTAARVGGTFAIAPVLPRGTVATLRVPFEATDGA